MLLKKYLVSCVWGVLFTWSVAAFAQELGAAQFILEDQTVYRVEGEEKTALSIDGPVTAFLAAGEQLFVGVGGSEIRVYLIGPDNSLDLQRRQSHGPGAVSGFIVVEGQVWAKVTATTAIPLDALPVAVGEPTAASMSSTGVSPVPGSVRSDTVAQRPKYEGLEITHLAPGEIELNKGTDDGVEIGDRFAVLRAESISKGNATKFVGRKVVAIAEVIAVNPKTSLAQTGRSQRVVESDSVAPARHDQSLSTINPRRTGDITELSATLRPIIHVGDTIGVGALTHLEITYYAKFPMFFRFRTEPLAFGFVKGERSMVFANLLGELGYDGQYLGIGLGVSLDLTNGDFNEMVYDYHYANTDSPFEPEDPTHAAIGLSSVARLGPRDGLRMEVRSSFLYQKETNNHEARFQLGSITGRGFIPIGRVTDLVLEGGGGANGFGYGSIGVSSWVIGNGDKRSLGLSAHVGGAGLWSETEDDSTNIAGPMAGMGITYRL